MELPDFKPLNPTTPAHRRQNSGIGSNPRKPLSHNPRPSTGGGGWAPSTEQVLMSISENMRRVEESLRVTRGDFERFKEAINRKIDHIEKVVDSLENPPPSNAFSLWKGNPRFVLEPRPPGWAEWNLHNDIPPFNDESMSDNDNESTTTTDE